MSTTKDDTEVICAVCDCYEPHAWRKKVCRNCFHTEEDHTSDDKETSKEDVNKNISKPDENTKNKSNVIDVKSPSLNKNIWKKSTENLKDSDKVDSNKKCKPPETLPKSKKSETTATLSAAQRFKDNIAQKQKSVTDTKTDVVTSKKSAQSTNDSAEVKGKVSQSVTSLSSKSKQTTPTVKDGGKDSITSDTKSGQKPENLNKKQTPTTTTKVFTNSKLAGSPLLSLDKVSSASSIDRKKNLAEKQKEGNKLLTEAEKPASDTQKGVQGKTNKTKSDEADTTSSASTSKVKAFAKSFTPGTEQLDDTRFNSLGRKKLKDSATASPLAQAESKFGSKCQSAQEQNISQKLPGSSGTQAGATAEKDKKASTPSSPNTVNTGLFGSKNVGGKYGIENKFKILDKAAKGGTSGESTEKLERLASQKSKVDDEVEQLRKKLIGMEKKCKTLESENTKLKSGLTEKEKAEAKMAMQKSDVENAIKGLKSQLSSMADRCDKLETDNTSLMGKLKEQQYNQEEQQKNSDNVEVMAAIDEMQEKVKEGEDICEELRDENDSLKQEINDLKIEMDEMYDSFRDQEAEEFRDLQRELEITAKNCRILQFKLRKAERRNEQVEDDRIHYEEKLRMLQNQFEDHDARAHIRSIEQELQMAKEVSVRLHDELDIMEDRRSKVEEENRHLTDILEKSDKKQFRLEMEIDKLKDQIVDLRSQLAKSDGGSSESADDVIDRRVLLGRIGKQSSQELDSSQLMKDLYDSMERETDLKDQLKFLEEECKSMRKKAAELEEENENLSVQLKKMSFAQATRLARLTSDGDDVTEAEVELKVQLELNEQELHVTKKKVHDLELENENLKENVDKLTKDLQEKDVQLQVVPEPSSPNSYYEDKMKEMKIEADDMRWKLIEKEREIERLEAQCVLASRQTKLRKSRSLESDHYQLLDIKKQLDASQQENLGLREQILNLRKQKETLAEQNKNLQIKYTPDSSSNDDVKQTESDEPEINKLTAKIAELEKERNLLIKRINEEKTRDATTQDPHTPSDLNGAVSTGMQGLKVSIPHDRSRDDVGMQDVKSTGPHDQSRDIKQPEQKPQIEFEATNRYLRSRLIEIESENKQLKVKLEEAQKSVVVSPGKPTVEGESKEELMDQILDMEEEMESLSESLKAKHAELDYLYDELKRIRDQNQELKDQFRKKEIELLQDLDHAQDKNDILSNLLDIVKERADAAEQELERIAAERSVASTRSARIVSALSDTSTGSDEVFDGASGAGSIPGSPETSGRVVITKDWENQFKKRIDCLERLLAEERKKLATTEKKLALISTETLSTAMSDDAKLHEREKELLQAEVLEGKKHLRIATDQIKCLREKVLTLEEDIRGLHLSRLQMDADESEDDRTPSGSIDTVIERSDGSFGSANERSSKVKTPSESEAEIISLTNECEMNRVRIKELEHQLEEVNDFWQVKISNTEKEKDSLETEMQKLTSECAALKDAIGKQKEEDLQRQRALKERENMINEKVSAIDRKEEIIQEQEEIIKQREEDLQSLLDQISLRDEDIRVLRESLRNRDERLQEKDNILENINSSVSEKDEELNYYNDEISSMQNKIQDKDKTISVLEEKIADYSKEKPSDIKTENIRLKSDLDNMATNIGKIHIENTSLQSELEKSRQAVSEAMVLWNKDRSVFESELNIAKEKLFMYENTDKKTETQVVATLRRETHRLLEQKEKLAADFRVLRVESEANLRTLKNEKLKLQEELTQKIRHLTNEMTSNDKMSQELERLRAQEDIAYQIQHHEKVLRAEYLAMKVRYETRLENLQKDHMKLLTTLDSLQREKVLDKEIIRGVQKGMGQMKETYAKDLTKWNEEKEVLSRHIKEIEEGRSLAKDLENKIDELKCQLADQEYERAELINKMTTERSGWEVERSNMQSKINQLQEKLVMVTQAQSRTKDMQNRMEVAWERERSEQKRLLAEAHGLALDLQSQLKVRDDEHARERRMLLEQLKRLRTEIDEEQLCRDSRLSEIEEKGKTIIHLERRLKDTEERAIKDAESSVRDRAELVKRLGEMRKQHKRDQRRIEDVLSGLTRLRELAAIVVDSEKDDGATDSELVSRLEKLSSDPLPELEVDMEDPNMIPSKRSVRQQIDQIVLKNIRESLKEIHFAVEDISRPRDVTDDEKKKLRRSLSSSEIDFLKEEFLIGRQRDSIGRQRDSRESPKISPLPVQPEVSTPVKYHRSITQNDSTDVKERTLASHLLPEIQTGSFPLRQQRIMAEVHKEQGLTTRFPDPPPSFLLPRCHHSTKQTLSQTTYSVPTTTAQTVSSASAFSSLTGLSSQKRSSPVTPKTISLDTSFTSDSLHSPSSMSGGATPTSDGSIPIPILHYTTRTSDTSPLSLSSSPSPLSGSSERLTPRSARKKFFEDQTDSNVSYPSWSGRSSSLEALANKHIKQHVIVDPDILCHEAGGGPSYQDSVEEDIESAKPRTINKSISLDDKTIHSVKKSHSTSDAPALKASDKPTKPKRNIIRRAQSVDSSSKHSVVKTSSSSQSSGTSNIRPGDIFATMKRKIKTTLRRSSSMTDEEKMASAKQSCSDASGSETEAVSPMESSFPPPTPPISAMSRRAMPEMMDVSGSGKKRTSDKPATVKAPKRLRSKSAERAHKGASALKQPITLEEDLIPDQSKAFSETSV